MSKMIIAEADITAGTTIHRAMTIEEIKQDELDRQHWLQNEERVKADEAQKIAIEESRLALKASAKQKLINGEPLTLEEAEVLVL